MKDPAPEETYVVQFSDKGKPWRDVWTGEPLTRAQAEKMVNDALALDSAPNRLRHMRVVHRVDIAVLTS